jgi:hypothetical protein
MIDVFRGCENEGGRVYSPPCTESPVPPYYRCIVSPTGAPVYGGIGLDIHGVVNDEDSQRLIKLR